MLPVFAAALLALQAAAAPAAQSAGGAALAGTAAGTSTPVVAPKGGDKIVCHKEQELGSLLGGHNVCHPQSVWDQMARDAHDNTNNITRLGNQGHMGGGGG